MPITERPPALPARCSLCGQLSANHCRRCGRALCSNHHHADDTRCPACEEEFASRALPRRGAKRSRSRIVSVGFALFLLFFALLYPLTGAVASRLDSGGLRLVGSLCLLVPPAALATFLPWLLGREDNGDGAERERFLRERRR